MNKDILVLAKELKKITKLSDEKKLRHYYNNSVYNSRFLFFNNILDSEIVNKSPYRNIILNFLKKAESYLPGGSILASKFFINAVNNISTENAISKEKNIESLKKILDQYVNEESHRSLILNTLKFAGPDGSIFCNPSKNNDLTITKKTNAKIEVKIDERFINIYFNNIKETTKEFVVIALDAYLERESEIITVLEHARKLNLPLMFFARGISDYFAKNIKEIIVKNNLYVYPYIVKFDNSDPFLFDDICSALDLEKITAEAGHSFYKDLIDKSKVKKIKVSSSSIEFFEKPTEAIENINKKLSESLDIDLRKYLIKRKNRLSPNIVEVLIPENQIKLIQDFKSIIKVYNILATSGCVLYKDFLYPKYSFNAIKSLSESIVKSISDISVVVKLNK